MRSGVPPDAVKAQESLLEAVVVILTASQPRYVKRTVVPPWPLRVDGVLEMQHRRGWDTVIGFCLARSTNRYLVHPTVRVRSTNYVVGLCW